jgi:hypothetical protein
VAELVQTIEEKKAEGFDKMGELRKIIEEQKQKIASSLEATEKPKPKPIPVGCSEVRNHDVT